MPITLSQLTANRKALTIAFEGGDLHVEYYPQRLTAKMLVDFAAADPATLRGLAPERMLEVVSSPTDALAVLLASWDFVEDTGEVRDIKATLPELGIAIQWTIYAAIMGDSSSAGKATAPEGSANTRRSGAGSSRRGR